MTAKHGSNARFMPSLDIDAILTASELADQEFPLREDDEQELSDALAASGSECAWQSGSEILEHRSAADNEISALLRIYEREFPDVPMPEQMQECIWDGSMEGSDAFAEAFATRQANTEAIIATMFSPEGRSRFKLLRNTIQAEYEALGHPLRYIPITVLREYIGEVVNNAGVLPFLLKPERIRITKKGMIEISYGKRLLYRFKLPAIYRKWAIGYKAKIDAKPAGSIAGEIQVLVDTAKK